MSIRENTNRRLKEVLDIMAEGSWLDEKPNGGEVLAEAVARVPFTPEEAEILSGGIPRGHKNLTKATADLVRAGWMSKGRGGWVITDNGLRATVAFDTVDKLTLALSNNTQVPAGTPLPEKPTEKMAERLAEKAAIDSPAKTAAAKTAATTPAVKSKPAAKKPAKSVPAQSAPAAATEQAEPAAVAPADQPESVALAGDFGTLLGAENWDPSHKNLQMTLEKSGTWKLTADLPAGHYSYKAVVNGSWEENYGAYGVPGGANHEFHHAGGPVSFHYNHATKDVLRAES